MPRWNQKQGFSIPELLVALVILTVGVLALAATTGYLILQVRVSELRTARATAVQQAVEELRSTPFTNLSSKAESSAETIGDFSVWWSVQNGGQNLRRVRVYTLGPGYDGQTGWTTARRDSFAISLADLN